MTYFHYNALFISALIRIQMWSPETRYILTESVQYTSIRRNTQDKIHIDIEHTVYTSIRRNTQDQMEIEQTRRPDPQSHHVHPEFN